MLKNNVREQIKSKFNLKKTSVLDKTIDEEYIRENTEDELYKKNNLAIIDVPNYLDIPSFNNSKTLLICLFQIVTEGLTPFLLYLLHSEKGTHLQFITMISFDGGKHNKKLTEESVVYMKRQLNTRADISYAGFTETSTNNILFLKYISLPSCDNYSLSSDYYWATTHELVNLKTVMNIPIALTVTDFFIKNPILLQLKNEEDIIYETPVIGYYICDNETNDIYRENRIDKYGKCYYFDINMPEKQIVNCNNIIRAAIFLNRTGLINNTFHNLDSIVYNKDKHYYLIKSYAQHTALA